MKLTPETTAVQNIPKNEVKKKHSQEIVCWFCFTSIALFIGWLFGVYTERVGEKPELTALRNYSSNYRQKQVIAYVHGQAVNCRLLTIDGEKHWYELVTTTNDENFIKGYVDPEVLEHLRAWDEVEKRALASNGRGLDLHDPENVKLLGKLGFTVVAVTNSVAK